MDPANPDDKMNINRSRLKSRANAALTGGPLGPLKPGNPGLPGSPLSPRRPCATAQTNVHHMPLTWPRFTSVLKATVITEDTTRLTFSCGSSRHAAAPWIKQISGSNLAVGHGSLKRLTLIFTGGHASPAGRRNPSIHDCSQKFRGCLSLFQKQNLSSMHSISHVTH